MEQFIQRHREDVIGVVSGFDRVRLRGTLRLLATVQGMMRYLGLVGVLLKDFTGFAKGITGRVQEASAAMAETAGRRVVYLPSSRQSKEDRARQIASAEKIETGLICVLTCVEPCLSYTVRGDKQLKRLRLVLERMKCLHHYFYFLDPVVGFLHVRLQTWFPFTVHIGLNGRQWLACQMRKTGIESVQRDNCFVALSDVAGAQRLLDAQVRANWAKMSQALLDRVHPTHAAVFGMMPLRYYWSMDSSEWATDVMFRSADSLSALYPWLLRHAMQDFDSAQVMRFLGHKIPAGGQVNGHFTGEVLTDLRRRREGVRIKHWVGRNNIKMYNKQGSVLRVETTVNDVHAFKSYRASEDNPGGPKRWRPMRKGVADVARRAQVCQAANQRYLQAQAALDAPQTLEVLIAPLCRPVTWRGKRVRALQPLADPDATLIKAIMQTGYTLNGFRNRDLRTELYPRSTGALLRKRAAKITRLLRLLRAHGLIRKVSGTHRYTVTDNGRTILTALLNARRANSQQLLQLAA